MVLILLALLGWSIHDVIYYAGVFTLLSMAKPYLPALKKKIFGENPDKLSEKNPEKDVVYIYQIPGTPTVPSISPFAVKVEAFCRLHNIKYKKQNSFATRGENGQLPFVELNGEIISDSQVIIRKLTEKLQLQAYPDAQSAAVGHTIDRMLDNHTFNLLVHTKLNVLSASIGAVVKSKGVPSFLAPVAGFLGTKFLRSKLETRVQTSIGIFSEEQYIEHLRYDLVQLQEIVGKKKFLLGDEPTAVDCTALGQLGAAYYAVPARRTSFHDLLDSSELSTLKEYVARTKETIYGNQFFDSEAQA